MSQSGRGGGTDGSKKGEAGGATEATLGSLFLSLSTHLYWRARVFEG